MNKTIKYGAVVIIWLVLSYVNAGFIAANFHAEFPRLYNKRWCREDVSVSLGLSLIPVIWLTTPFLTGLYQDGWEMSCANAPLLDAYGYEF